MNTAIEEQDPGYYLPVVQPEYAFLRDDPEFQQLCRKMFTPQ
jgi:hypothetical protein